SRVAEFRTVGVQAPRQRHRVVGTRRDDGRGKVAHGALLHERDPAQDRVRGCDVRSKTLCQDAARACWTTASPRFESVEFDPIRAKTPFLELTLLRRRSLGLYLVLTGRPSMKHGRQRATSGAT